MTEPGKEVLDTGRDSEPSALQKGFRKTQPSSELMRPTESEERHTGASEPGVAQVGWLQGHGAGC